MPKLPSGEICLSHLCAVWVSSLIESLHLLQRAGESKVKALRSYMGQINFLI